MFDFRNVAKGRSGERGDAADNSKQVEVTWNKLEN